MAARPGLTKPRRRFRRSPRQSPLHPELVALASASSVTFRRFGHCSRFLSSWRRIPHERHQAAKHRQSGYGAEYAHGYKVGPRLIKVEGTEPPPTNDQWPGPVAGIVG